MATIVIRSGRRRDGHPIIVDEEDGDRVARHTWTVSKHAARSKTLYAKTAIQGRAVLLHRLIMNAAPGDEIDHIDGNGLNNSKANLRFVSRSENMKAAWRLPGRYDKFTYQNVVTRRLKDGTVKTYRYPRPGTVVERKDAK